jgi:hypothetical protein
MSAQGRAWKSVFRAVQRWRAQSRRRKTEAAYSRFCWGWQHPPANLEVSVDLDECFAMIARLSPHAAKLAARMLRKDPAAPPEWAFALEVGLGDRAHGSEPLTTDDLLLIAMDKDPKHFPAGPAAAYSAQQVQAIEFVRAVRRKGPYPVSAAAALGGGLLAAPR